MSPPVLGEAERNIRNKLSSESLERYYRIIVTTPLLLTDIPSAPALKRWEAEVGEKDAQVLAAGLGIEAPYLVTLDQKLAERINQAGLRIRALSPGEFIRAVLPHHVDYASLDR